MQINYVNHACLVIESADTRLLTDPWFAGPAYARQWHPFPKPVDPSIMNRTDVIAISHAHEDHLHEGSLNLLDKNKRVFYPFNWYQGTVEWLRSMGFADVTEAISCRSYEIGPSTRLSFIVNGHDSIIVVEDKEQVVVNVNDALHSSEPFAIDAFTRYIKERWPRIDVVMCGFGGASYYPNTIHGPGKDDHAVAWLREQLFTHNFCRIVSRLEPRIAVPFAADFALLAPEQQWINTIRFPREWIPRYFREQGGKAEIAIMYSGDRLVDGRLEPLSPLRDRIAKDGVLGLLPEQYPTPVSALIAERPFDEGAVEGLRSAMEQSVSEHAAFYPPDRVTGLTFSVRLRDVAQSPWLNVSVGAGGRAAVVRGESPLKAAVATIDTTAEVLGKCMESEWGGDAIIIGYAADVHVAKAEDLRSGLGKVCVELCVRHPRPKAYALSHPGRVARFLAQTPFALAANIKHKFEKGLSVVNGPHWLSGSARDIRNACGMPECQPPQQMRLV